MTNTVITIIKKSDLQAGMTVEVDGVIQTVCQNNLINTIHGVAFKGSAYPKEITRIQYAVPTAKGIVLR